MMASRDGVEITWLGHAAFRIRSPEGTVILTDPFLNGNPSTPEEERKQTQADIILVSHGHADNLGDVVEIARETKAQVPCIFEIAQWLGTKRIETAQGMNIGGTVEIADTRITMVQAWHSSSIQDGDSLLPGGTACGFVIRFASGYTIYFSGDTGVFLDMKLIAKLLKPDLAILSIGDHFTMGPEGAAEAIRLLGVREVVPMHYGTFPMLTGTPAALRNAAADVDGLQVHELQPGDTLR
jgi:L-ascorbate metabolism protein UlaG (beta-lactamase superfamily)